MTDRKIAKGTIPRFIQLPFRNLETLICHIPSQKVLKSKKFTFSPSSVELTGWCNFVRSIPYETLRLASNIRCELTERGAGLWLCLTLPAGWEEMQNSSKPRWGNKVRFIAPLFMCVCSYDCFFSSYLFTSNVSSPFRIIPSHPSAIPTVYHSFTSTDCRIYKKLGPLIVLVRLGKWTSKTLWKSTNYHTYPSLNANQGSIRWIYRLIAGLHCPEP